MSTTEKVDSLASQVSVLTKAVASASSGLDGGHKKK